MILYVVIVVALFAFLLFNYLQNKIYGKYSTYIYNIHIDCLSQLVEFLNIKHIDIERIKKKYFDHYCEENEILFSGNILGLGYKTNIEISIYPIKFYQNIVVSINTRNVDYIKKLSSLHLEPTPLWQFYNYITRQKYKDLREFIVMPPPRFNNWFRHNFKPFWDNLSKEEKKQYCEKYNAPKEWQDFLLDDENILLLSK